MRADLSGLSPEEWATVSTLLDEALTLQGDARSDWLLALTGRDPRIAKILDDLLRAQPSATNSLQLSSAAPARLFVTAMRGSRADLESGAMVGDYRLVRPLGIGGMASVWLAEQTSAVLRQVALKIPHSGIESWAATSGRFLRERDLLAGLEHERIARLYDAGISLEGVPFLAMEWIDGISITAYCDQNRLSIAARLALFRQVLEAVAFAHSRFIIHRDLKASNILVTARGQVKLLDFGVANLLSSAESPEAVEASDALTPDTSSPEQLLGAPLSTASDVYSLGIILYELLAGCKPYALDRAHSSLHEALLAVHAEKPSAAITAEAAGLRGLSIEEARRALRGELEAIVERCLARSLSNRYPNVEALALELERLTRHEPVAAYGDSWPYRLRCFVRRRRWPLLAATALAMVLLAGVIATLWQTREALAQARRAEVIQKFLLSLFRSNTPSVAEGHEVTAKDLLVSGSARLDSQLKDQPVALATLHSELGDILNEMGDDKSALDHLDRALAGFAALKQGDSTEALEALFRHGTVLMDQGNWDRARADLNQVLARGLAVYGPRHRWAVGAREKLAFILNETDQPQGAIDMATEALAQPIGEDVANDALRRLRVRVILGEAQTDLGRYAAARATLTQAVEDSAGPSGYSVVDRLVYRLLLARAIFYSGDALAAEPAAAALVTDEERVLGPTHPLTFAARQLWAHSLSAVGRYDDALIVARDTLRRAESRSSPSAESIAVQRHVLATELIQAARYAEAIPLARLALSFFDAPAAGSEQRSILGRRALGLALLGANQLDEAQSVLGAMTAQADRLGAKVSEPNRAEALNASATFSRYVQDFSTAATRRAQACSMLDISPGADSTPGRRCRAELAWLYAVLAPADSGKTAAFDTAARAYASSLPHSHLAQADLELLHAELDAAAGRAQRASVSAAREQWRQALGRMPPDRIMLLH